MPDDNGMSWKEVYADLKGDIMHRFDKQDAVLAEVRADLANTATKRDLRDLADRVDSHERRIAAIEDDSDSEEAVRAHKRRAWAIAGTIAGIAAVVGSGFAGAVLH